jgi:uncharacterized repeat protein (TIGR03803 family)
MISPFRSRLAAAILAAAVAITPARAQPITVIHTFTGYPSDGSSPGGALVPYGSALYGTTVAGGAGGGAPPGLGTIYRTNPDGTGYTVLHNFLAASTDGNQPLGTLAQAGGVFYGATEFGGSAGVGTVFSIDASGANFGLIHTFLGGTADGYRPESSPVLAGGVLYVMTAQGGTANLGIVYRMNPDGTGFQVLHSFTGGATDGRIPHYQGLVVAAGVIYGATETGGAANLGVVFRVNTDGTGFAVLHSFAGGAGDGLYPDWGLTLVGGTLYGMTGGGGTTNSGTIFRVNTDGTGYAVMHNLADGSSTDGALPQGNDLVAVGSTLYGMTRHGGANALGVLLHINLDGTGFGVDHSFAGGSADGADAFGTPIDYGGLLYATTGSGGSANDGVVFSFTPIPEPSSLILTGLTAAAVAYLARRRAQRRRLAPPSGNGG